MDRQELCDHLRCFAIRQEATQTRGALHQFGRRLIRAHIAQDCPGGAKMRQAALAVQDPRISNLNAAEPVRILRLLDPLICRKPSQSAQNRLAKT